MSVSYITTSIALICIATLLLLWRHWHQQVKLLKQQLKIQRHQLTTVQVQNTNANIAQAKAESANSAKNRYLSGISHELRTPLNVIMGYAQLLEKATDHNDPNHHKYQLIRKNCEHLTHLIEGILEFSAIESGKLSVQSDVIDLLQLLQQISQMFDNQATQKNLVFKVNFDSNLPRFVKTDRKRLQQILINLLSNAIKFTAIGTIEFKAKYRNQIATFTVIDSGCGIEAANIQKIFQPFERIENNNIPGTGLGLTITQLLVELLGGELTVNSQINQGSEFKVKLMLSAQSPPLTENTIQLNPVVSHKHKILIVDDLNQQRELTKEILSPYGFTILTADSAQAAKQILNSQAIDLMLLDVAMPDEDGWQLAEWCGNNGFEVKIIMLSANPRDNDPQRHQHHQAYLAKPLQIDQLLTELNRQLDLGWQLTQTDSTNEPSKPISIKIKRKDRLELLSLLEIGHINGVESYLIAMHNNQLLNDEELSQLLAPLKQLNTQQFTRLIHGN
jgi:signal transduction histidine kinase/DNA-binding LytR/AlgR family response regulator